MEKKLSVHIGMTAYNSEKTLAEAWSSIRSQDYQDWHMTLIDAGSSDGTWAQCQEIASVDERVRVVRMEEQTSWFVNAKRHLHSAERKYFMLADADDCWSPNWITENLHVIEKHRLDASFGRIGVKSAGSHPIRHVADGCTIKGLDSQSHFLRQVRFAFKPEVLGKANLIYSVWRTSVLRDIFPWNLDSLHDNRDLKFLVRGLNRVTIGSAPHATIFRRQSESAERSAARELRSSSWTRAAMTLGTKVPTSYPRDYAENIDGPATRVVVYGAVGARALLSGAIQKVTRLLGPGERH